MSRKNLSTRRSTLLCAILKNPTLSKIRRACALADLIEFRLDLFKERDLEDIATWRGASRLPVLFTMKGFSRERIFSLLQNEPDYVDLDYTTPSELFLEIGKKFPRIQRIASQHSEEQFSFDKLFSLPAEIYKAVYPANSLRVALEMLCQARKEKRRFIGICTKEKGRVTRLLAPLAGAPFVYAPLSEEDRTAEGQLLLEELLCYNVKSWNRQTMPFGLIGSPLSQSPGERLHNLAFAEMKINALYTNLEMTKEELPVLLPLLQKLGFRGLSVTCPLKEEILSLLNNTECSVAVNTLRFQGKKRCGFNTDGRAALDLIEERVKVRDRKVLILGYGGAARGIGEEAERRGAHVAYLSRTPHDNTHPLSSFREHFYDVLINATPIQEIVPFEELAKNRLVMDTTLKPLPSRLLAAAEKRGCGVIDGMQLFIKQAAYQYEHWNLTSPL